MNQAPAATERLQVATTGLSQNQSFDNIVNITGIGTANNESLQLSTY